MKARVKKECCLKVPDRLFRGRSISSGLATPLPALSVLNRQRFCTGGLGPPPLMDVCVSACHACVCVCVFMYQCCYYDESRKHTARGRHGVLSASCTRMTSNASQRSREWHARHASANINKQLQLPPGGDWAKTAMFYRWLWDVVVA